MYQYFPILVLFSLFVSTKQECFIQGQPGATALELFTKTLQPVTDACQKANAGNKDENKVTKCFDAALDIAIAECDKKVPSKTQGPWVNCFLDKLSIKNKPTEELTFKYFKAELIRLAEDKKVVETTVEKCASDPDFWYCALKKLYKDVPCPLIKFLYEDMDKWKTGKK